MCEGGSDLPSLVIVARILSRRDDLWQPSNSLGLGLLRALTASVCGEGEAAWGGGGGGGAGSWWDSGSALGVGEDTAHTKLAFMHAFVSSAGTVQGERGGGDWGGQAGRALTVTA